MEQLISKRVSVEQLLGKLQQEYSLVGRQDRYVDNVAAIHLANERSLCFCSWTGDRGIAATMSTNATILLCSQELPPEKFPTDGKTFIIVEKPRLAFIELAREFFVREEVDKIFININ